MDRKLALLQPRCNICYCTREDEREETQINLNQTCHDRAHSQSVPEVTVNIARTAEQEEGGEDGGGRGGSRMMSRSDMRSSQSQEGGVSPREGGTTSRQTSRQGGNLSAIVVQPAPYEFADPCPASMRHVRIADLSSVDINWKMLTLARPTTKIDEDIFSK